MKKHKKVTSVIIILALLLNISGCSAYTEINDLPLVLGVAIDKGNNDKYLITVEVFKPTTPTKDEASKINTEILQAEGITIFDAIRDLIIKLGKRAYWTHLKVLIISKDISKEGISPILDMFNRNAHIRKEFAVLISKDETASKIFYEGKQTIKESVSIFINDTIKSADKSSKFDYVKFYELIDNINIKGQSYVLPLISMNPVVGKRVPSVYGLALLKKDKMVGALDTQESKTLRLLNNKEKGGVLIVEWNENNERQKVTLEIFGSKTKLEPLYNNGELSININITTTTEIAEIMNYKIDVVGEKGRERLKKAAENDIKNAIEKLLSKLQHDLKCDAIGLGKKVKAKYPYVWREYESNWSDVFETIPFQISVDVKMRGTATISEQFKIEE
jgi:spore germination protein KC